MTVHHCPKCDLAFTWQTELDDHCRQDHPEFRHEYPAVRPPVEKPAPVHPTPAPVQRTRFRPNLVGWLQPKGPKGEHRNV